MEKDMSNSMKLTLPSGTLTFSFNISWNIITKSGEWKWKYLTADNNNTTMELCFRHGSAVGFNLLKNHQFLWTENFGSKLLALYNGSNWKRKMEKLPMWNWTTQQWKKSFTTCSYHIRCCVNFWNFFRGHSPPSLLQMALPWVF